MKKTLKIVLIGFSSIVVISILFVIVSATFFGDKIVGNSKTNLARARQSEAKTVLLGIYASEKMYQVEKDAFTDDFNALEYEADGQSQYLCGFYQGKSSPKKGPGYNYVGKATPEDIPANAVVSKDSFTVACVGYPDPEGPLDVWTINEKRELIGKNLE